MAHNLVLVVRNYSPLLFTVVDVGTNNGVWVGQNVVTLAHRLGAGRTLRGHLAANMPWESMDARVTLEAGPGGRLPAASIEIGFGLGLRADGEYPWVLADVQTILDRPVETSMPVLVARRYWALQITIGRLDALTLAGPHKKRPSGGRRSVFVYRALLPRIVEVFG